MNCQHGYPSGECPVCLQPATVEEPNGTGLWAVPFDEQARKVRLAYELGLSEGRMEGQAEYRFSWGAFFMGVGAAGMAITLLVLVGLAP